MIFIGERINTGFKEVKAAVLAHDASVIKEWAVKQTKAKATYLDVNLGAASAKVEDLCWMIEQVQSVSELPISIDTNKYPMLKEAVPLCKKPPLINSTPAIDSKMREIFPLVAEYGCSIIGLVMDEAGSPKTTEKRVEIGGQILATAMEYGIPPDHVFLDPIVMPMKYMQDQARIILAAASQFQLFSDPPPHVVCGLSNVSNGAIHKKLINRTFAVMMAASGMDAVILDVTDEELVNALITADLVMNRSIYADSYLEAFRS
jgi:5-methyltetrahydrofolate corrinoid/iron sulfur protein methyltransferase